MCLFLLAMIGYVRVHLNIIQHLSWVMLSPVIAHSHLPTTEQRVYIHGVTLLRQSPSFILKRDPPLLPILSGPQFTESNSPQLKFRSAGWLK